MSSALKSGLIPPLPVEVSSLLLIIVPAVFFLVAAWPSRLQTLLKLTEHQSRWITATAVFFVFVISAFFMGIPELLNFHRIEVTNSTISLSWPFGLKNVLLDVRNISTISIGQAPNFSDSPNWAGIRFIMRDGTFYESSGYLNTDQIAAFENTLSSLSGLKCKYTAINTDSSSNTFDWQKPIDTFSLSGSGC